MMRDGSKRKSSLDCDVGLGLKMQLQTPTESHSYDGGGGPIFGGSDIYEASYARNFRNTAVGVAAGGGGGGMAVNGKALFTASQWEELERQSLIHKYIMASIPVPPHLLLPISNTTSQSNNSGLELKYSSSTSGSDPEPWRCKRTDGKKWRCSRDVAPDHKYCERHAHKSRPRSRKHVEIQSHNHTNTNTNTNTTPHPLQRPTSQFPTMASTTSYDDYDQTRCMEWFMRGGSSVTACNQQPWQHQLTQTSSSSRYNRDNSDHNIKNVYQDKLQAFMGMGGFNIPHIPEQKFETLSTLNSKIASLQNDNADRTQTTRHFIDAWGKESTSTLTKKFSPSSSLTLSMNTIDHNNEENGHLGIGMRDNEGIMKFGGPLGEALCLGNNATTTRGNSNLASSPADHGYSNNTNSISCSKSSCEDGNHAFNFIG